MSYTYIHACMHSHENRLPVAAMKHLAIFTYIHTYIHTYIQTNENRLDVATMKPLQTHIHTYIHTYIYTETDWMWLL